ncbi:hypothetical protein G6F24_018661 [Rhizopus arrhizus]|nr:hypothetical protein G6F24_018661 [Rhizopus arrhizus]
MAAPAADSAWAGVTAMAAASSARATGLRGAAAVPGASAQTTNKVSNAASGSSSGAPHSSSQGRTQASILSPAASKRQRMTSGTLLNRRLPRGLCQSQTTRSPSNR